MIINRVIFCFFLVGAPGVLMSADAGFAGNNVPGLLEQGIAHYKRNDPIAARREFMSVLRLDPNNHAARIYMDKINRRFMQIAQALVNSAANVKNKAENDLQNALTRLPDDPMATQLLYQAIEQVENQSGKPGV